MSAQNNSVTQLSMGGKIFVGHFNDYVLLETPRNCYAMQRCPAKGFLRNMVCITFVVRSQGYTK